MEDKQQLRGRIKAFLEAIPAKTFAASCRDIHEQLFNLREWRSAQTIAVTVSMNHELDTRGIIERAWQERKTVCVPKCSPRDRRLFFRKLDHYDQLESVYFGLLEPMVKETLPVSEDSMDMIVVPGLLFDKEGYRVGFGGGYYDRFLHGLDVFKVAQALDEQVVEHLPREKHDVPVHAILTPTMTVTCQVEN